MRIPTDLEVLEAIHSRYYHEFASYRKTAADARNTKVYVPIDVDKIGIDLSVEGDIVFGRLYYHFNNKHNYIKPDGVKVEFFALELGPEGKHEKHCIQFPLMTSVLAGLKDENRKYNVATNVSLLSLLASVVAILISLLK